MFHNYPYTDFHELNLDYIMSLARKSLGIHLETQGKFLKLVNQAGDVISKLEVTYAQTALQDDSGHNITSYILNAGINGNALVLTKGNGEDTVITIPYAIKASKDVNNVDLTSYVHNVEASGDNVLITFGNGTTASVTVPYAVKAQKDVNNKDITTYVANLSTANDKLIVRDGDNVVLAELTIPYAVKASQDEDGDVIEDTYSTALTTGTTTIILRNKNGASLSEITVPYAVKASSDNAGNALLSDYGYNLATSGNKVTLEAHDGTTLNQITVPFATISDHANNAIESVSVVGDTLVFTDYSGNTITITVPYAVKALKDNLNNTFTTSYIANAVNDTVTGKITFYAQDGSVIAEMTPTVDKAVHDSYNNTIANYIKTIVTDPNSDYVTVTHGTGTTDTLTVHYSTKAWKDTYDNVIGNVYIKDLDIITDSNTGHKVLVAYNGESSELFRLDIDAYSAQVDINGTPITDYVMDVTYANNVITITKGDGTTSTINIPTGSTTDVYLLTYTLPDIPTAFQMMQGHRSTSDPDLVSIKNLTTNETLNSLDLSVATKEAIVCYYFDNFPAQGFIPYSPTNDFKLICDYGNIYSFFWIESSSDPADIENYWLWTKLCECIGYTDYIVNVDNTGAITTYDHVGQTEYILNYFTTGKHPRVCYNTYQEYKEASAWWIEDNTQSVIHKNLGTFFYDERFNTSDTFYICTRYDFDDGHKLILKIPFTNSTVQYRPIIDDNKTNWITVFT